MFRNKEKKLRMFKDKEKNKYNLLLKIIAKKYGYSERYVRDSVQGVVKGKMPLILSSDYQYLEKEINNIIEKYQQKVSEKKIN